MQFVVQKGVLFSEVIVMQEPVCTEPEQLRMFEDVPIAYRDPSSCTEAIRMLDQLRKEEARHHERLKRIAEERDMVVNAITVEMVREYPFTCLKCGNQSALHRWILSRLQHYVQPHGCTEGDFWVNDRLVVSQLCCPDCDGWNYLFSHPQCEHTVQFLTHVGYRLPQVFDATIRYHER